MNLNCGLIGLPMVGKTTIFNLLTGADAETSNFNRQDGDKPWDSCSGGSPG